ncbi:MAG: hypothetical protein JWM28_576 [Chitinophagaceae bacterium]|nr:hypothetical protein [Chitinophagaceae bacterium]
MRKQIVFLILLGIPFFAMADHITGGQMYYKYTGTTNGLNHYNVTLKLYMRCNSGRQFPDPGYVSVFDKSTFARISDIPVSLSNQETLTLTDNNPCITNPPIVCYIVGYYNFIVSLASSVNGYILSAQINFRIDGISNLVSGYGQTGATYTTEIPGTSSLAAADINSSAHFTGVDLVVSCAHNAFSYNFAAVDEDSDELHYYFCNAYATGGGGGRGGEGAPASPPPYSRVPYGAGYSGSSPLGNNVKINASTGLITGLAPTEGIYVVTVCVDEIRNGVVIATQRKDLQVNIADCNIAAASLLPDYLLCGDTKTITISNQSVSPLIKTYNWDFFDNKGDLLYSSSEGNVSYSFPDTGSYSVKLVINRGGPCSDSVVSLASVYPGFVPAFEFSGICIAKPTVFTDASTSVYGTVNSWEWDFGDNADDGNFSENTTHTFAVTGPKNVQLIATDTKGCRDTITKTVNIVDKPPIQLAFRDTLICLNDKVPLLASGSGIFSWTPEVNIVNENTPNPIVSPTVTSVYFVHLDEEGCLNDDSVKINVVDHVTLQAMNDTTICSSDTIQLKLISDGLNYSWTPASQINNALLSSPVAVTDVTTTYNVTAVIGSCSASDRVVVNTVPYPTAKAGDDKLICYNTSVQLQAASDGNIYLWTPAASLTNASILNPVANPQASTDYVLFTYDSKGCPKPGKDTVLVTVLPDIIAFAGRDTAVVTGQPLHFNAAGGVSYLWEPSTGLSANDIADPVGIYNFPSPGILYKLYVYNEAGCTDSAFMTVKVFNTKPSVFVPTAFTPNSDGRNDRLRPIAAGMKNIEYFNVYDRWGQLVFSTHTSGEGWDGTIGGQPQGTGTFVWIVKAMDYSGMPYFQKGITTLIR